MHSSSIHIDKKEIRTEKDTLVSPLNLKSGFVITTQEYVKEMIKYFDGREDYLPSNILVKDNNSEDPNKDKFDKANDLDFWETNYAAFSSECEETGQKSIPDNEFIHVPSIKEE